MKRLIAITLMMAGLDAFSQNSLMRANERTGASSEILYGVIAGQIKTTDGQPAAFVTVYIKENSKTAITGENGEFIFKNLKDGIYTLEITMVGLKSQERTVQIKNGAVTRVSIVLSENAQQLSEVVIQANQKRLSIGKINIADKDFPQSTAIVTGKIISDQQAIRLGDVVKNVPGVSLVQTRLGVNESYGARGYIIGIGGGAGGGSIFKNGLPANIAGMPEAATLESVEIIKGSTAFLYGSSSGGLIINMITKKPKYNFGGEVSINIGSYHQYKPVVDVYGPISKNLAFRVVGSYENDRSYRNVVKTIRKYVNPSLMYKFGKSSTLIVQGDYLNAQLTPDGGVGLLDSGRVVTKAIPRSRFQNVGWAYNHVKQSSASAEFKRVFNNKFSFNASASYQNTDVDSYGVGNLNTASPSGIIARPLSRAHNVEKDYASQITLEGKFNTSKIQHHFIAGADFTKITTYTDAFTIYNTNGSVLKTYDTINLLDPVQYIQRTDIPTALKTTETKAPSNRAGVFVQDLVSITNQFKLFVGIRYSYQATVQTTIDSMATTAHPFASTTKGAMPTATYNVFSPKVGLVYQPNANTSLYASYSNSFTTNTGTDIHGNLLPASIINQYEIGAKNSFENNKLSANISVYRIINSNLAQQAAYLADGTPNTNSNIKTLSGETTSDGVEIGLNGNVSSNFYFITGYGYNFIRFTHTSGTKGSNIEGERVVDAPAQTANATVFYGFKKALKGLKIGATGFYTGSRFGGYNNKVGQPVSGSRMIALSGFATVDLYAGYTHKKLSLQCKLSNIFNELNYLVHDNYSITPIAPRQLMATVSYKF